MKNEPAYKAVYRGVKQDILKGSYPISGFLPKESWEFLSGEKNARMQRLQPAGGTPVTIMENDIPS